MFQLLLEMHPRVISGEHCNLVFIKRDVNIFTKEPKFKHIVCLFERGVHRAT